MFRCDRLAAAKVERKSWAVMVMEGIRGEGEEASFGH
jgi:hypothetical protein